METDIIRQFSRIDRIKKDACVLCILGKNALSNSAIDVPLNN